MKKITYILFLISTSMCFGQDIISNDLEQNVLGVFLYGNSTYLVTEKGFIGIPDDNLNSEYERYYQEIYKDSTIVNPNTVIGGTADRDALQYIVPFVRLDDYSAGYTELGDSVRLHDFLFVTDDGNLVFRRGISGLLERYLKGDGR